MDRGGSIVRDQQNRVRDPVGISLKIQRSAEPQNVGVVAGTQSLFAEGPYRRPCRLLRRYIGI